jgi:hypothetical protein
MVKIYTRNGEVYTCEKVVIAIPPKVASSIEYTKELPVKR